jgi:hypothetical protein
MARNDLSPTLTRSSSTTRSRALRGHFSFWRRKELFGGKIEREATMDKPEEVNNEVKPEAEKENVPKEFKLEISLGADGKIAVMGPLDNQLICMGMLEMGKEAIINFHRERAMKQAMSGIQKAGIIPAVPPLRVQ